MSKEIIYGIEAREKLKKGVDAVADAVKSTLGPKGRLVGIQSFGTPHFTKDGVTVAKDIYLECPFSDMGCQSVKSVSAKAAELAGDGTTTATVLAQAMVAEGFKMVTAGANPMDLKRGMDLALKVAQTKLKELSREVGSDNEKIKQVATISANNDEFIGNIIGEAFKQVGNDGVIVVEVADGAETEVKMSKGMELERGMLSPFFATSPQTGKAEFGKTRILLYDGKITTIDSIVPLFESVIKEGSSFLIIADDFESTVLKTLVANRMKADFKVCAIKAPSFGQNKKDILQDIAILTNGLAITPDAGMTLEGSTVDMLGTAEKVEITNSLTTVIGGNGSEEAIEERVEALKGFREESKSPQTKEQLTERIGKLDGGVATIYVGAASEVEMKEKKDRVDDALAATRAATQEGIVPGGGMALINCISGISSIDIKNIDQKYGANIVAKACEAPLRQIVKNCGVGEDVVINEVTGGSESYGFNAKTEEYQDLYEAGVIDPTMVTRVALENAISVASTLLTTECLVADKPSALAPAPPAYPGMPGM